MKGIGGGYRDDIDLVVGEQVAPVAGRAFEAEGIGLLSRQSLIDFGQMQ